ncbi:MAG TPA: HesA/MoeB/ThiF family protein [Syntrophomonadaceae bacterium]|nr:HesA/MoeB/ThiF family protein [Syntrophomonadaceae bacterium]HNX28906.1 HesA/MoeB/ThiF family protein [Syntrophomonadaceae bacterium]HPR94245.1 HesA/MoeB/ThiF family protein [Syntrophomonadaceae bacterium]
MSREDIKQITWQDIKSLAAAEGINPQEMEKNLLKEGGVPLRYIRNIEAISQEEQRILVDAAVGVCGCGGLGLYVINHLARMGVGHITVWDPDVFSESNLNRQLWSSFANLGQSKVEVCRKFIAEINPAVKITAQQFYWEENVKDIFLKQQVIVDALDNIPSRLRLADVCAREKIPLVHGAVGGWYGQLTVIMPGDNSLRSLYGEASREGIEKEMGTLPFTAAAVGSMQAAEVIKLLTGRDSALIDEICMIDMLDLNIERFKKCNNDVTNAQYKCDK